jgi:hypothetical protein
MGTSLEDRLNGATAMPWIPDPAKAEKYEHDSCNLNPLIGIAVDHYRRPNFMGDAEYDVLVLNVEGVGDVAVHCQPTVLANEMHQSKPRPGERVGVKWLGEKTGANRTYTAYKVVVERGPGGTFSWTDSGEPEPVAAKPEPESGFGRSTFVDPDAPVEAKDDIPF